MIGWNNIKILVRLQETSLPKLIFPSEYNIRKPQAMLCNPLKLLVTRLYMMQAYIFIVQLTSQRDIGTLHLVLHSIRIALSVSFWTLSSLYPIPSASIWPLGFSLNPSSAVFFCSCSRWHFLHHSSQLPLNHKGSWSSFQKYQLPGAALLCLEYKKGLHSV